MSYVLARKTMANLLRVGLRMRIYSTGVMLIVVVVMLLMFMPMVMVMVMSVMLIGNRARLPRRHCFAQNKAPQKPMPIPLQYGRR